MKSRTHFAVFALLGAAVPLSGFQGGCGQTEPVPIPQPSPSPSPTACTDKNEAQCTADSSCTAVYVESACACPVCEPSSGTSCMPCECPPPSRTFVGCQDRDPCEGLDQVACEANPACDYVWSANDVGGFRACDPADPSCGAPAPPPPGGTCVAHHECPPVCAIFCEFGNVVDENGCATCGCNPPPDRCAGLDEVQCTQTPGCSPLYGSACACPSCAPGAECPPCDCAAPPDGLKRPTDYQGCILSDPCAGLPEDQCIATPGCEPIYSGGGASDPAPGGGERPIPPPNGYGGCVVGGPHGPCENLDEMQCNVTPGCHGVYESSGCAKPAPPACDPNDPSCGGFCDPSDPTCGGGCTPETRFAGCFPDEPPPVSCTSNADCRSGEVCALPLDGGAGDRAAPCTDPGCGPPNPPPPVGQCVPGPRTCDDGLPTMCDAIPPVCEGGLITAAQNGCYACVDPVTCQPPTVSLCSSDAECVNGYCDATGSGGGSTGPGGSGGGLAPPPPGVCAYPNCDDGSPLMCRMLKPVCDAGLVASIINGCYQCLDARTCAIR